MEKWTYLDDGSLTGDFEDLTFTYRPISENNVDDLGVSIEKSLTKTIQRASLLGEFNVVEDNQRTIDSDDSSIVKSRSYVVVSGDCFNVGFEAFHRESLLINELLNLIEALKLRKWSYICM